MKRLERYSTSKNNELIPVLRVMDWLHLLRKEDKNSLGWK